MNITITHRFEFPAGVVPPWVRASDLQALEARLMSALSDKIAEVRKSLDATTNRVQTDVATLQAKIDALQGQVDAGSATQADIDALESLKQDLDKIDPQTPSTV